MRIAWDNLLKVNTTISSVNEDSSYPLENLYNKWKKLLYKSTGTTDTITVTFSTGQDISCFGISYHNLTACNLVLKDGSDVTVKDYDLDITNDNAMGYFTTVSDVYTAVITVTSPVTLYIGAMFIGEYISDEKTAGQNIPYDSTANTTVSAGGQVAGRMGVTLRSATVTIPFVSSSERAILEEMYAELQEIYPFWIDLWHDSHSSFQPLYCHFTSGLSIQKDENQDATVSFEIQEAK